MTWEEYKEMIVKDFANPASKDTAAAKLERLEQGSCTAKEFVQEFKRIMGRLNYSEDAEIQCFKKGLNPALKRIYNGEQEKVIKLNCH